MERKVNVVLLKESLQGKGPECVFGDAGVEARATPATALAEAVVALAEGG